MSASSAEAIVIGAGPAGCGAAIEAASAGVDVVVLDEGIAGGGQVYRPLPEGWRRRPSAARHPDLAKGDELRRQLAESGARTRFSRRVWSLDPGYVVEALGPEGPEAWQAGALVLCPGTSERILPFPGWTLPGVIGLAAATVLLKAQQATPGERVLVAGRGPLLYAVASGVVKAGGAVAAVLDAAPRADWLRALPALARRPGNALRGLGWLQALRAAGTPVLFAHAIRAIERRAGALRVLAGPLDPDGRPWPGAERAFEVDGVAVGHGLVPASEPTRLLGAEHRLDEAAGGWVPVRDEDQRTTLAGLYVAGDAAGILGADPALAEGRLAGLALARDLGRIDGAAHAARAAPLRRRLARHAAFGRAMAGMMAPRPGEITTLADDVVVCRCEDVTRGEIEQAIAAGAGEVNQLKAFTRCGMGPCQGRMCGDVAARLVAARTGSREAAGVFTARPPLRPLVLDDLVGTYDHADIRIPEAAPL